MKAQSTDKDKSQTKLFTTITLRSKQQQQHAKFSSFFPFLLNKNKKMMGRPRMERQQHSKCFSKVMKKKDFFIECWEESKKGALFILFDLVHDLFGRNYVNFSSPPTNNIHFQSQFRIYFLAFSITRESFQSFKDFSLLSQQQWESLLFHFIAIDDNVDSPIYINCVCVEKLN